MESLSKFVRSRMALRQSDSGKHLLGNELNAFAESSLTPDQRSLVLAHLGACSQCREILALASVPSEAPVELIPTRRRTAMWKWRVTAGVVAAGLVVAIVWFPRSVPQHEISRPAPAFEKVLEPKTPLVASPNRSVRVPQQAPRPKNKPAAPHIESPTQQPNINENLNDSLTSTAPPATDKLGKPDLFPIRPSRLGAAHGDASRFLAGRMKSVKAFMATPLRSQVLWDIATGEVGNQNENGTLLKSTDEGKSWQSVRVDGASHLDALSVSGPEIWVGGSDGALFHSVDNGLHWARIVVSEGEERLAGTITRIAVGDDRSIRLTVSRGGDWTSLDGGLHWQQP